VAPFKSNENCRDLEQVRHLMPAYQRRYNELLAAKQRPYNDSFKGHLGTDFASPVDEDWAIYLCQTLRDVEEDTERVTAALAEGFEPVEKVDRPIRGSVIHYGFYMGGNGFRRWDDVTLVAGMGFLAIWLRQWPIPLRDGHVLVKDCKSGAKALSSAAESHPGESV